MNKQDRSAAFKTLVRSRARATLFCFTLLCGTLAGNLLLLSSFSEIGARRIISDTPITVSVACAIATIFIGAITTIVYILWANKRIDPLTQLVSSELNEKATSQ